MIVWEQTDSGYHGLIDGEVRYRITEGWHTPWIKWERNTGEIGREWIELGYAFALRDAEASCELHHSPIPTNID